MGAGPSKELPSTPEQFLANVKSLADRQLSPIEKHFLSSRNVTDANIAEQLGVSGSPGEGVLFRSANFMAAYPFSLCRTQSLVSNLSKVITLYNGKLTMAQKLSESDRQRLLFLSIAAQAVDPADSGNAQKLDSADLLAINVDKYYVAFGDLIDLFTLLLSFYDKEAWEPPASSRLHEKDAKEITSRLLAPFKAPVVKYDDWILLLELYPGLVDLFARIWDQLLYDPALSSPEQAEAPDKARPAMPQSVLVPLILTLGPRGFSMLRLFDGGHDGFSMRAFEGKVFNWKAPTVLVVSGRPLTRPAADFDSLIPPLHDLAQRPAHRFVFAVVSYTPWKTSTKQTFADENTLLLQLAPEIRIYKTNRSPAPETIYFDPKTGIGVGQQPPQSLPIRPTKRGSISLLLDSSFQYGVFRNLANEGGSFRSTVPTSFGGGFEDRFLIDDVRVWGLGSAKDLAQQQKAWEWEKREAERRKNVNVGEDRAILELAGLVGQYPRD